MLPWECVFNILDFPAHTAADSFYLAQAAAVENGGGVVYFPAGTYHFTAHLLLNSSVAVRGAPTTARAKAGKLPGPLAPATRFTFVDRMHFGILNLDPRAKALAVVNVAIEFGSIMLWPGLAPAPPSPLPWPASLKTYWYGATGVVGAGSEKHVLSNTVASVAFGATDPANPGTSNPWAYRFSHAIAVYADANSLVANNLLPFSPAGSKVTIHLKGDKNASETQPFPYDTRYGVDNKLLYGAVAGAAVAAGGACGGKGWGTLTPACGACAACGAPRAIARRACAPDGPPPPMMSPFNSRFKPCILAFVDSMADARRLASMSSREGGGGGGGGSDVVLSSRDTNSGLLPPPPPPFPKARHWVSRKGMRNIRDSWHSTAPVNTPPRPTPMADNTTVDGGRVGEGVALGD
jgi:hypothetical protein